MVFPALAVYATDAPVVTESLAIGRISAGGRRPVPDDAIADQIARGRWVEPKIGDVISFRGRERTWHTIKANDQGWYEGTDLDSGYLFARVESAANQTSILTAQGDGMVYVNGAPRAGDPYSYGYLHLPVYLHKGANELLFAATRGRLRFDLTSMNKPFALQAEDATLPDILTTDRGTLWAGVTALNGEHEGSKGLAIRTVLPDGATSTRQIPSIPGLSIRKVPATVRVPRDARPGPIKVRFELLRGGNIIDEVTETLDVRGPNERHKRTFVSNIDGSVQYFAVAPALKPSPENALVETLHGASVEATGQIAAYAQKPDVTLVGPTNRRPYGFDWEDIGRLDALEVLQEAKRRYPHDPDKVDLTGHSMGGHGTWAIGTLYPGLFASIAPSAGWVSFWSYAGGWNPEADASTEKILRRSMNVEDTLGRVDNTLSDQVYILHGDQDDNVPVGQARMMKAALTKINHPHLQYHEQPGAGHWWGSPCVDWPPIFAMIEEAKINPDPNSIDFTTQNPAVSADDAWVTIEQQSICLEPSRIQATRDAVAHGVTVKSENVRRFALRNLNGVAAVTIDSQTLAPSGYYELIGTRWVTAPASLNEKSPERSGPFKNVFNRRFLFVFGTGGSKTEAKWAADRARFDAETMAYRGNGAVEIVSDRDYRWSRYRGRNVILYGNATTNSAWSDLMGRSPIQVSEGSAEAAGKVVKSGTIGGLILYPNPHDRDSLVGAVCGTGFEGMRSTDRLPLFLSGTAFPDWILLESGRPDDILADGFFDNHWKIDPHQTAWAES